MGKPRFQEMFDRCIPVMTVFLVCTAAVISAALVSSLVVPYQRPVRGNDQRAAVEEFLPSGNGRKKSRFKTTVFDQKKLFDYKQSAVTGAGQERRISGSPLILLGVSFGERKLAVLRDEAGRQDYYVSEGESAAGFEVRSIEKDKVILQSGATTLELTK